MSGKNGARDTHLSALNGVPVLVVEDVWQVAKALKAALEQLGMHVLGPAATTAEARRLLAQGPKLAVVDVNLNGELACSLIDELHVQGVAVIVVSGYAVPPVAMEKASAFLQKPFSPSELVASMLAIVRQFPERSA